MTPGAWLRAVRKAAGYTKAQVARRLEATAAEVTTWESDPLLHSPGIWRLRWYAKRAAGTEVLQDPPEAIRLMVEIGTLSHAVERILAMGEEMRRMKHQLERSHSALLDADLHPSCSARIAEEIDILINRIEQGPLLR